MITKTESLILSADKKTPLRIVTWLDEKTKPSAIVQIVHGMTEYVDRYEGFAQFLAEQGYAVVGHDHLAHGKSVLTQEQWGVLSLKEGKEHLIADVKAVCADARIRFGEDLPCFMFAHSMGSFIARCIAARGDLPLTGLVLSGTGNQPPAVLAGGKFLARLIKMLSGDAYRSTIVYNMAQPPLNKPFEPNNRTAFDWLTRDEQIVDAYTQNPACTFHFSVGAYYSLFSLLQEAGKTKAYQSTPKDLPILLVSGGNDPVGSMGKEVEVTYNGYLAAGLKDVTMKLYPEARHEILNELNKEEVSEDILAWIKQHL